ncbi:non-homologous end joining protein Ku [Peristeroidobacter agariperforans]|uniref:non-homologous end joining protein Ku n=1 Tax=Peristeroidobacter agariperforans TaxID=268404 RepID=UPI00101C5796|nr:Ku protein [Peristeroidobacter agariperforans]
MPSRKRKRAPEPQPEDESSSARVRSLWSGTITFGLVSIPVDLLTAVRPRQTAMKLVDTDGHALGRQYHCSKEGKKLDYDDLVRGYETDDGKMVVITDKEFESVAPEMSADIELRSFVPLEQVPALYFQKPYFLAPAGKSAKAYVLLAETMQRTGRVAIGSFVMRGHEYLVAIVPDNGVLRLDTLRYADEIRTPETIGLPKRSKASAAKVTQFAKEIEALTHQALKIAELEDQDARKLQSLVESKQKERDDVIHPKGAEAAEDSEGEGAKVIDLMEVLRKSLSNSAVVRTAEASEPINLAERRAQREARSAPAKKKAPAKAKRKAPRKRARRS